MAEGEVIAETPSAQEPMLADWPERPWLLAGLGGLAGLIVHLLLDANEPSPARAALAAAAFFSFAAASFVLRPKRWSEAAVFAVLLGLVMGGIAWLAVDSGDHVAGEEFAFAAGVFFSLLAVPLFQADFHRKRWATPYRETHFHVWTDAVSAAGALAFVLLSWLLLWLLRALFSLIGIELIEDLIETTGFVGLFCGATYGAAMGVLRNQLNVLGTLQRVVLVVFSLLAVPFGFAIAVFLVFLLLSGGSALWDATDSATPVLLTCALGCFVLANAVVRDDDEARSDNVVMQAAAMILAASIFPLTVFAAISMGIRIDQHGLSPERLWALVAIAIATAYGLSYWVGLARGRMAGWAEYLRRANLHLAAASCVVALVLALPLIDFGGISARQQMARLDAGEVAPEDFDFRALRWDFGDAGRDVLAELAERDGEIGELALAAQRQSERPYWYDEAVTEEYLDETTDDIVVYPAGSTAPDGLLDAIDNDSVCWIEGTCRIYLQDDGRTAVVLGDECDTGYRDEDDATDPSIDCGINVEAFELVNRSWRRIPNSQPSRTMTTEDQRAALERERQAIESGDVSIGPSQRRTIYIGDKPTGRQFD
ncbi:DUF4153 domain-containing protein [Aurantiacibacter gilvus]|uniref:DUF4153 domain-containing protein n=1 Tax=Aurantiacibacter gilvus TaxID=3139141 RepID=A0ABU9IB77_9SPHN